MIFAAFVLFMLLATQPAQANPGAEDQQRSKAEEAYERYSQCVDRKAFQEALVPLNEIPEGFRDEYKVHFCRGHALLQLKAIPRCAGGIPGQRTKERRSAGVSAVLFSGESRPAGG